MKSLFSIFALSFLLCKVCSADDDLTACGGFIKSTLDIPFEKVKIKLMTKSGNLKYETEGAPNNGYYLIPLYDKGDLELRVGAPNGWTFEPMMVPINYDGKTDPCSQNKDINFDFKGFSVFGKVTSQGSTNGPAGVSVSLLDTASKRTVQTVEGGHFVFPAVMPGSHKLEFKGDKVDITMSKDNYRLADNIFVINGYSLEGSIEWDAPLSSAYVALTNEQDIPCCSKNIQRNLPEGFTIPSEYKVSCVVKVDASGKYEFPCVKSANNYAMFAQVLTSNKQVMDIAPNKIEFDIAHKDASIDAFQVTGFPVSGHVKGTNAGVQIKVLETGFETVTDKSGNFKLSSMRSGKYTLQLKKAGFQFDPKEVEISPEKSVLPDLEADKYEVCGEARVPEAVPFIIKNKASGAEVSLYSDISSGRLCAFLEKGVHIIKPNNDQSRVRLAPNEVTITVPLAEGKRIVFSQFSAVVQGRVDCVGGVCPSVKISLNGNTNKKMVANSDGTFKFEGIDAGTYEVCADHSSVCFEKKCLPITVIDKNIDNLVFVQKGFTLRLDSSHKTDLEIAGRVISVAQGLSTHCVVENKPVKIKPVGCHVFANQDSLMFDPKKSDVISLQAEKHRLRIVVSSPQQVEDLKMVVKQGEIENTVNMKDSKKVENVFQFSTDVFVATNSEVKLEAQSAFLLFKPHQMSLLMPNDCHKVQFEGKTGIYVEGSTTPVIADAEVSVTSSSDSHVYKTKTNAQGKYKAGPLDSTEYTIEINKEGYAFNRVGKSNDFSVIKFSRIDIKVVQEGTEAPLQGALISLSGGQDYRNNSKTGAQGDLTFIKLSPGQYFLRVMMKEYKFEPLSTMVEVTQGSEEKLVIRGKKVAYSVMGKITSITGEGEAQAAMEAISEGCDKHEEDAVSDDNGFYRIRGLKEGCEYDLRLKKSDSNSQFERSMPASKKIKVGKDDITDVNVIVFRPIKTTQITVSVDAEPHVMPALKVILSRSGSQVFNMPASKLAVFSNDVPRDGREYTVELELVKNKLPHYTVQKSSSVTFVANTTYQHVELEIVAVPNTDGQQAAPSSPFVAIISVFVAIGVYFRNDLLDFLKTREERIQDSMKKKNKTK